MEGGLQGRQFHQADDRLRDWEGPAGNGQFTNAKNPVLSPKK